MKTPFGIHAEYVSERAVNNCVNMYKKDAHKIVPGKIGRNQDVIPEYKDSLDCPIDINEIGRLKIWHKEMHDIIDNCIRKFPILRQHQPWGYVDGINIQYYKPGGGYPREHAETMGLNDSHRIMAFMTYLTNTENAGTKFTYLKLTAPCKKGLTLIWPANYLYAHKGVISKTENKMIITGWIGYQK